MASVANPISASGVEDAGPIEIVLTGSVAVGEVTKFEITPPKFGKLYADAALTDLVVAKSGRLTVGAVAGAQTLYFQPDHDFSGSVPPFTYRAAGVLGRSDWATVTIDVAPVNDAPVASDVFAAGKPRATVEIVMKGTDVDGTVASFTVTDLPAHGTLFRNADGTGAVAAGDTVVAGTALYFRPDAGWNGTTAFHYRATDNQGMPSAAEATATISIAGVNEAPVVQAVSASGVEDAGPIAVVLTATDPDGTVAVFQIAKPASGTLYTDAGLTQPIVASGLTFPATDGTLTLYFQPNANFNGSTQVTYRVIDDQGARSAFATATIDVAAVNDAPVALNLTVGGKEDLTVTVLMKGTDVDGTVASFTVTDLPAHGTLSRNADGSGAVAAGDTVAAGTELYFKPDADWSGTTAFHYRATDDLGVSSASQATATINIAAVNDAPVAPAVSASGVEDAGPIAIVLTGSDVDGTVTAFQIDKPKFGTLYTDAGLTQPLVKSGTAFLASGGTLTLYFQPAANFNGSTQVTYRAIDDQNGRSALATATIDVAAVNDAPVALNLTVGGREDVTARIVMNGTDVDGTVASFTVTDLPAHGTLSRGADGTGPVAAGDTVAAGTELYFKPDANWSGTTAFHYRATDDLGVSSASQATATINIAAVNDAPVAPAVSASGVEDAGPIAIVLTGSDVDGTVTAFQIDKPKFGTLYTDAGLTQPLVKSGTAFLASGGTLTLYFQPAANFNGSTQVTYRAIDDQNGSSALATATIDVAAVNDAPVALNVFAGGNEGATVKVVMKGADADGTVASFTVTDLPAHGTLFRNAGGTGAVAAGDMVAVGSALYFRPDTNWNGTTTFHYRATDNEGASSASLATATINVVVVNDAPVAHAVSASGVEGAGPIEIVLTGADTDGTVAAFQVDKPASGKLYFDAGLTQPLVKSGAAFLATGGTLTLYFQPAANFTGSTEFTYRAIDNQGGRSALAVATIDVAAHNDAPVAFNLTVGGREDVTVAVLMKGTDADGTVASFTVTDLPAHGALFRNADGTGAVAAGDTVAAATALYFKPDANWNGTTAFHYRATDDLGVSSASQATATITIAPVNDRPVAAVVSVSGVEDEGPIAIVLTGTDTDGTIKAYQVDTPKFGTLYLDAGLTQPITMAGLTFLATGGTLTLHFQPNANFNGNTYFTYKAIDNEGSSSFHGVATIDVAAVNDAPVALNLTIGGREDVTVAVLMKGTDADGTVASFAVTDLPAHGALFRNADGTGAVAAGDTVAAATALYFKPDANWNGTTAFHYRATDDLGVPSASQATATITIAAVNDRPVAAVVSVSGVEDEGPITIVLTGTDTDGTIKAYQVDTPKFGTLYLDAGLTQPITMAGLTFLATGGTLTLHFQPNANFNGNTYFTYKAIDNEGSSSFHGVATIDVAAVNDAPVALNLTIGGREDVTVAVLMKGTDADGTVASFAVTDLPAHGALFRNADGTGAVAAGDTVAAATALYFKPDANWNGTTAFHYRATDDLGVPSASQATATITIAAVNERPVAAVVSVSGVEDEGPITIVLTGTDTDGTIKAYQVDTPKFGTLYLDAGLTQPITMAGLTFLATGGTLTLYFQPNANFNGNTYFTYKAIDNQGSSSSHGVATIDVAAVNDAPVALNVFPGGKEDLTVTVLMKGTDADGTVASFAVTDLPAHGTLLRNADGTGAVAAGDVVAAGAALYFKPDANWNGTTAFHYRATDDLGVPSASQATATISIAAVNDRPVAAAVSASGVEDEGPIAIVLSGTDIDGTIKAYQVDTPAFGTLYLDAGLTQPITMAGLTFLATGGTLTLHFQPNANFNGSTYFTYKAIDSEGSSSFHGVATIDVAAPDNIPPDAPTITSFADDSGTPGDGITSDATLLLSGSAEADAVVEVFDGAASLGTATADGAGAWSFATPELSDGAHSFTATATDAAGNTGAASSALAVTVDSTSPVPPASLTQLTSPFGFIIQGDLAGDRAGTSVSSAGDFNGDGFADLIVGAPRGDDGGSDAGEAYVVFGKAGGFGSTANTGGVDRQVIDLTSLSAADGFVIRGDRPDDRTGTSVSSAGDVNGDGLADLIVGAPFVDFIAGDASTVNLAYGAAYVLFGTDEGVGTADGAGRSVTDVTALGVADGFVIRGDTAADEAGISVAGAGDVNGDGFADLIVGAHRGDDGGSAAGEAYVVFGKADGFGGIVNLGGFDRRVVDLAGLGASDGFIIQGDAAGDYAGFDVSAAGDVNGDGFADLIVGATGGNDGGSDAGESYVVFGKAGGFGSTVTTGGIDRKVVDLTSLSAADGFVVVGERPDDRTGRSVSSAGDVNGDGFTDLIIGAPNADFVAGDASTVDLSYGAAYVLFGKDGGFGTADAAGRAVTDVTTLSAADGFIIRGDAVGGYAGFSVSAAGDVNGDGFGDLVIGAPGGEYSVNDTGKIYLIFGKASGFGAEVGGRRVIDVAALSDSDGFVIQGDASYDYAGTDVSAAGDVNGDGFADIIIGAPRGDDGGSSAGEAYVVFGGAFTSFAPVSTAGASSAEILIGGRGGDTLSGGGGADVFRGGAGDDTITVPDLAFRSIDGGSGTDTLVLSGADQSFDFATVGAPQVAGIEAIDFAGTGDNILQLLAGDVLRFSDSPNDDFSFAEAAHSLVVTGNAGDTLELSGFDPDGGSPANAVAAWQLAASNVGLDGAAGGGFDVYNLVRSGDPIASLAVTASVTVQLSATAFQDNLL